MSQEIHNTHMKLPKPLWLRARQVCGIESKNMTQLVTEALELLLATRNNHPQGK